MKRYHHLRLIGLALLGTLTIFGCSDDVVCDVDGTNDNLVYLNPARNPDAKCEVLRTPAGVFGRVATDLTVSLQYASTCKINVSATINADTTLVGKYNRSNGTSYELPSADILNAMEVRDATISAGKTTSDATVTISLAAEKLASLTAPAYIIPVKLTLKGTEGSSGDRPIGISSQYDTSYILVSTSDADDFTSVVGNTVISSNIVKTPVGTFGGISASVKIKNLCAITGSMLGYFEVDNSLIAEYNAKNGTSYSQLPESVLSQITITTAEIKEGETESKDGIKVSAPDEVVQQLDGNYLLPLRLKTSFSNGVAYTEDDVVYLTIETKSTLINDDASEVIGSEGDHSDWSIVSANHLNPDNFTDMFAGGWTAAWKFTESRISEASFVVDLGSSKKLTGFNIDSYVMTNAKVSFSSDNVTWNEIGNTSEHKSIYDENWNRVYVLYGAVTCRYLKFELTLNPSSWAWNYSAYGYDGISGLSLYFNE